MPLQVALRHAPCDWKHAQTLRTYLAPLINNDTIALGQELAGDAQSAIAAQQEGAAVILLLVTKDLVAQPDLMMLATAQARVVPILVGPALWDVTPLSRYRPVPQSGVPVTTEANQDQAWHQVIAELRPLLHPATPGRDADPALVSRLFGHAAPLLGCDRSAQFITMQVVLARPGHELIVLPGARDQAHDFFLERLERLATGVATVRKVSWSRQRHSLSAPPFPTTKSDFLAALAPSLGGAVSDRPLLLMHPLVGRNHDDPLLPRYYKEFLPELLVQRGQAPPCKVLQPIDWAPPLSGGQRLRALAAGRLARADEQEQAAVLLKALSRPHATLPALTLPALPPITKQDVFTFLDTLRYAETEEEPQEVRRQLAERVVYGDATSEQILRALCRELPDDLLQGGL